MGLAAAAALQPAWWCDWGLPCDCAVAVCMVQRLDGLALTIALETGDVGRFDSAGNFASYARTVSSRRESNGKKKG